MTIEIKLPLNSSAEPHKCGSCSYFDRNNNNSEWNHDGQCKFQFPPTRIFVRVNWDGETKPLDTVNDTDGCSFHKPTNETYIVSKRVKPH